LGIGISQGYIALASSPTAEDARRAASALSGWGELIAVLLEPFHLDGVIYRRFATGTTAGSELARFVDEVGARHARFAFLLKELQETTSTGVAVRMPDGGVHIELITGHFITKGVEEATSYRLDASGVCIAHRPGAQSIAVQVKAGRTERVPVTAPPCLRPEQLAEIHRAVLALSEHHPEAGIEFGHTPSGEFFLVDLYQGKGVRPPERENVLSEGRVMGRIRILDLPDDALEQSIERHIHSARLTRDPEPGDAEILVVRRPYHLLDQWVYKAAPGCLGVVCEGGALLCHLAVVMRERGVPALVRPGALGELREGERFVLDTRPGSIAGLTRVG
jgi:phosphohistidine swiveling domain-containing protein